MTKDELELLFKSPAHVAGGTDTVPIVHVIARVAGTPFGLAQIHQATEEPKAIAHEIVRRWNAYTTLEAKLDALDTLIKDILSDAAKTKGQFTETTCPLAARDHETNSQLLEGIGSWRWQCPFCGKKFEE